MKDKPNSLSEQKNTPKHKGSDINQWVSCIVFKGHINKYVTRKHTQASISFYIKNKIKKNVIFVGKNILAELFSFYAY